MIRKDSRVTPPLGEGRVPGSRSQTLSNHVMFRKLPLATIGLVVGGSLTAIGIVAYVTHNATLNLAGFFYGIPLILGGLALKSSELKPVPFLKPTPPEILSLREQQATYTQNKLRLDVTRYRYGQDVHLDEALKKIGLSPSEEERPVLEGLWETSIDNHYALVLQFESSEIPLAVWQQQQEKIEKYFGPGIRAEFTQADETHINFALITTSAPTS